MANIGRGGVDATGANARVLARIKKKKKKGQISKAEYQTAVMDRSAVTAPIERPDIPKIAQDKPTIGIPGAINSGGVATNVKNLTQAYYQKWNRFPTSQEAYAMLQGTTDIWTVNQWWDMLKPLGDRKGKPAIDEYKKAALSGPSKPRTAGLGEDIEFEGMDLLGNYINTDMLDDAPSLWGKSWAWAEGDVAAGNHRTPGPNFVELPKVLKELDTVVRVGLGGMSTAEQQYYQKFSSGIIAYKQFLAEIRKKNGKEVNFDPTSSAWSPELDKEYHKYLFSRVAPYAILSSDVAIQEKANSIIRELYPKIFGEEGQDLTGVSTEKSINGLVSLGMILKNGGVPDKNIQEFCYNNFVDGRVPGQSEKKAMYDYVSEFGAGALPSNALKAYNDSVFTLGKAVSAPFVGLTDGAKWAGEATDFLFDSWKDQPGAWGTIGDGIHHLYNKAFTELNPLTSEAQAVGWGAVTTGSAMAIDMLLDITKPAGTYESAKQEYETWQNTRRAIVDGPMSQKEKEKELAEIDQIHEDVGQDFTTMDKEVGLTDLFHWRTWVDQYQENQGQMAFGKVFNEIENELGLDQDSGYSKALDYLYFAADMYVMCKAGAKVDAFAKFSAIKGARKGFSGLRKLEEFAKPGGFGEQPFNLGAAPTNPTAAKPAAHRIPKGQPGAGQFVSKGTNKPPTGTKGPQPRNHHNPFHQRGFMGEVPEGPTHRELGPGRVGATGFRGGNQKGALREGQDTNFITYEQRYATIYSELGTFNSGMARYRIHPTAKVYKYLGADEANGIPDLQQLAVELGTPYKAKLELSKLLRAKGYDVVELFDYRPAKKPGALWHTEEELMLLDSAKVRQTGSKGMWEREFGPEAQAGQRMGQPTSRGPKEEYGKWDANEPHDTPRPQSEIHQAADVVFDGKHEVDFKGDVGYKGRWVGEDPAQFSTVKKIIDEMDKLEKQYGTPRATEDPMAQPVREAMLALEKDYSRAVYGDELSKDFTPDYVPENFGRGDTFPEAWMSEGMVGPFSTADNSYQLSDIPEVGLTTRKKIGDLERSFNEAFDPEDIDRIATQIISNARLAELAGDPLFKGIGDEIKGWDKYEKGMYGETMSNKEGLAMEILDSIVDESRGDLRPKRQITDADRAEMADKFDNLPNKYNDELQTLLDERGISPETQKVIRHGIEQDQKGTLFPEDMAGIYEMLRTSDEYDMNEVRGRTTAGGEMRAEVGEILAFLRGQRRYIADKLSDARDNDVGPHLDQWEHDIQVLDAQMGTLMRIPEGGLPALLTRALDIDGIITDNAATISRLKRGFKDSPESSTPAARQMVKDMAAQIDELIEEKRNIIRDGTSIDDVEALGGEWTAVKWGGGKGGPTGRYKGMPYGPHDLNRAPKKKVGEGMEELGGAADRTNPPSGSTGGKRTDYADLKNPHFFEELTVEDYNAIMNGAQIDGVTIMDLLDGAFDGVVLKDGTMKFNKDAPEFIQAKIDVAAGKPVRTRKRQNAKEQSKRTPTPKKPAETAPVAETPVEPVTKSPESTPEQQVLRADGEQIPVETPVEGAGTSGAEKPPKRPVKRPKKTPPPDPDALPITDPQYVHSKLLLTVAEYIAQFTRAGDHSDPVIARLLGLIDQPEVNKPLIAELKKKNNAREVLNELEPYMRQNIIDIDPAGPAMTHMVKAQGRESFINMADKLGALGQPLIAAHRIMGTSIQIDSTIDSQGSPAAVRKIGHSTKMGMDKMNPDVAKRINFWEEQMMNAETASKRRQVVKTFEAEIRRNMGEKKWLKFKNFEKYILEKRANSFLRVAKESEAGAFTDPKMRAYGRDSVPPARRELETNRKHLGALHKSAVERGDKAKAAAYKNAIDTADTMFKQYVKACEDYVKLANKKVLNPSERRTLNKANQVLNDMGAEQPVWLHQRTNKVNFSVNPRLLSWFQSGRAWQKYEKFDTAFIDKPVRLWKQWAMFGFGFPLRVYAGDEFWRIPMEGISLKMAREALATTRQLRGALTKKEQRAYNKLDAKDYKDLTDADKARIKELEAKMVPELSEYELRSLNDKEDFDWANDPSDSFEIVSPRTVNYTDADGTFQLRTELPDEPLYLPAVKHVIQKLGDNPTIAALFKEKPPNGGWTIRSVKDKLLEIASENSKRGFEIRQFLYDTDRITLRQMGDGKLSPKGFKEALRKESAGTYRNVDNVFEEWADVFVKLSRNQTLIDAVKRRHISIKELSQVNPADLFPVPVKHRIMTSNGLPDVPLLNIPQKIYNGVKLPGTEIDVGTLPLLTYMGTKIRDILWGTEYKKQLDIELKATIGKTEGYEKLTTLEKRKLSQEASQRAAQRAAHFVEKSTYVRDATVFEDMVRNALPFINSYRQFGVYWMKKMVTRPFTMGAIWNLSPNLPLSADLGPLQLFVSSFAPFFLQPNWDDPEAERDKTAKGMAQSIMAAPNFNPAYTAAIGFFMREAMGTQSEISKIPMMGGASGSLAPIGKIGGFIEGAVGTPEMLQSDGAIPIFKDDAASHGAMNALVGAGTARPDGGVGEDELEYSLPFPANLLKYMGGAHNKAQLFQSIMGLGPVSGKLQDPVAAQYLEEKVKYNKLIEEGKEVQAAMYLGGTKYLSIMKMIETSNSVEEMTQLKMDNPWAVRLSVGVYDWDTGGDVVFSDDWAKDGKDLQVYRNDLRDEYLQVYGGTPLDTDGKPLYDQVYGGDINREKAIPKMKEHLKKITEYARAEAKRLSGGDKNFQKSLMDEFRKKVSNDQYVDKYTQIPVMPTWYEKALKRDGLDPKLWQPKFYEETVLALYGNDFKGGNWQPSEAESKALFQMRDEGILYGPVLEQATGEFSKFGSVAKERENGLVLDYRKKFLYIAEEEWYDLDAKTLNRIGFNVSKAIDPVLLKVRKAYYDYKAVGEKFGTSSREYRDARNKFYAYKDKSFLAVRGGEIFVGGLPSRLMQTPFIVGQKFTFQGDEAESNQKVWKQYHDEVMKAKPDLKLVAKLKSHFNAELDDKFAAWKAQNTWYAVIGTAQYMRYTMKTSYSEYYQGLGNSVYTKDGQKMVKALEKMMDKYASEDYGDEENFFASDIKKYWDDSHSLSYKMLEWYMR